MPLSRLGGIGHHAGSIFGFRHHGDHRNESPASSLSSFIMSDDWLYVGPESDDYELSESYTLGGLCPVKLGDWVGSGTPPQYRIIYKLGFGSFRPYGWLTIAWKGLDVLSTEKTIWISSVSVEMLH
jgi:hypothetical protein